MVAGRTVDGMELPWTQKQKKIDDLSRRLKSQDALILELAERAGVAPAELERMREEIGPRISDEVKAHIDAGETIAAIKQYRVESGAGLAEAKEIVEAEARKRS